MYQGEETVVMDVRPFPEGQGFTGGDKWWEHVLSGDERERLDSMMGAALMDESISERLLNGVDVSVLTTFGLSEPTISLIRNVNEETLHEFAKRVLQILNPDDAPPNDAPSNDAPIDEEPSDGPPNDKSRTEPRSVSKLILIVDTDYTTQDRLAPRLRHQGHAVMSIASGERALPLVKAVIPDLIIVDVQGADLPGVDLVQDIRAISHVENTPIIIYTNSQDDSLLKKIRRISGTFIVSKSVTVEQLIAKVNAALGTIGEAARI